MDTGWSAPGVALFVLALGASYLIARLLWPFLPAIVTSSVLAVLAYPAHRALERRLRHRVAAALIGTLLVFFLVLLPLVGVSLLVADELRAGLAWLGGRAEGALAAEGGVTVWLETIGARLGLEPGRATAALNQQIEALAGGLAGRTVGFLSGIGGWLVQAGAALFTLYYLLRDGDALVRGLEWLAPLEPADSRALVQRARDVTWATVYGNVVVAIVQGVIGGFAFWILGLPGVVLWGTIMAVLSLLPAIGAWFVWVPATVVLIATGEYVRAVALAAVGVLIISTIDNVLRALLVSGRAQLHPLVVFFSVLGGLIVFGAVGVFVGPVLFVLALTLIEMARLSIDAQPGTVPPEGMLLVGGATKRVGGGS